MDEPEAVSVQDQLTEALARGRKMLAGGNPEEARRIATEVLSIDSANAVAMKLAGQASIAIGDVDRGIEMLDRVTERMPDQWTELNSQIVGVLWQQNRLDEAERRFVQLLQARPDFYEARRGLMMLLNERGYRFDANQQLQVLCRSADVQVTSEELHGLAFPLRPVITLNTQALLDDLDRGDGSRVLNVARSLLSEGRSGDAQRLLEQGDALKHGDAATIAFYGWTLLEAARFDLLETWVRDVVGSEELRTACKRYPEYWIALGGWAMHLGKPRQAVHLYAEAILREPGSVVVYDSITAALRDAGRTDDLERLTRRSEQVKRLAELTEAIVERSDTAPSKYLEIADGLDEVGRAFEARSWRVLGRLKAGEKEEVVFQEATNELARLLASEDAAQTIDRLLCGLDPKDFPLDLDSLMPEPMQTK